MSIQIGYIENISGDATLTLGNGTTAQLTKNMQLSESDIISTGANAQVVIRFADGSSITVGPNQSVALDKSVHDALALDSDLTQAEVDSLKTILTEDPNLSVFEETASGEPLAVGGSSLIVDGFVHHIDNLGDAGSSMLAQSDSAKQGFMDEEDDKFGLVVDDTSAVITLNDILTNDTTPTISGTTNDPDAEIIVSVGSNDYAATNNGDGTWTVPITGALPEGNTAVTVIATDPAGNTATDTAVITVDATPPSVTVDDLLTNDTTPTISGTVDDTTASIVVTIGANDYAATNNGDGTWSVPVTGALPEGNTTVTVTATDPAGNTATDTAVITVDATPPSVTVDDLLTNDTTPTISGTVDDTTASIVVTVAGSDYDATNNGDGTWSVTVPDEDALTPGDTMITVVATDPAGNESTAATTTTGSIAVDTTPPSVTINPLVTNDTTPAISGTTDDGDADIIVSVGGNDYTANNNGNGTWTLDDDTIAALPEGPTSVTVTATDPAGNESVVTGEIVVDTVLNDADNDNGGKVVSIDSITEDNGEFNNDFITNDTTLIIRGTYDNETGNALEVTLNGIVVPVVITDKLWEANLEGTPLTDGTHSVEATVTDAAGNVVTIAKDIVIDTSSTDDNGSGTGIGGADATVTLDEISDNYINLEESQQGITVTGTTTLVSGNEVLVELGGKTYSATAVGGNLDTLENTFSVTIPAADLALLTDGTYDVTATVVADKAGNTVSDTEDVIVDTTASNNNGSGTGIGGADATVMLDEISDNYINLDETQSGITVTGTTTLIAGNEVTVELNGKSYTATATGGNIAGTPNTFSVAIPTEELTVLNDGTYIVTATVVADEAGNTASDTEDVTVDTSNSDNNGNGNTLGGADATITLHEISNNYINLAETTSDTLVAITGTTTALDGSDITIRVDGTEFAVVQANGGTFGFDIPKNTFTAYPDGTYTVTAEVAADAAGNLVSDSQTVLLDTTLTDIIADGGDNDNGGNLVTIDAIEDNSGPVNFSGGSVTTSDKTIIIKGTFDSEPDTRLVLTIDGVVYTPVILGKEWTLDLTSLPMSAETHTVTATIVDVAGNSADVSKDIIITPVTGVLNVESITTDTGLSSADFITQDTTLVISGSMVDAQNNTLEVTMDGVVYTAADSELTVNSDGSWSLDLTANPLAADATYTLSVTETEAGTGTITTITQAITTDNSAPDDTNNSNGGNVVTIDSITEDTGIAGDFITNDTSLLIQGTFDNESGNRLSLTVNGNPYDATVVGNSWSLDLQSTPLADGNYTVVATVTDTAGNQVSQTQIIDVDTRSDDAGDATILLDPISDNYINLDETTSSNLIVISGSTTAANGAVISIYVDGTLFSTTLAQDGLFSMDIPKDTFSAYPDGTYIVTAEVTADSAGNIASDQQTVILDTSVTDTTGGNGINGADATVTLDAISEYINYADTQQGITVTGTTTLVAGNEVVVEINGKSYQATATGSNSATTPNIFSVTVPAADIAALSDGSTYIVSATIVADKAGNTVTDQKSVLTDFTAPDVTVNDVITTDTTPTITGATDDPTATIVVTIGSTDYTATNNGNGTWSMTVPDADALTDYTYDISVSATDAAGNESTATTTSGTITIDHLPEAFDNKADTQTDNGSTTSGNVITDNYNGLTDILGDGSTALTSITFNGTVYSFDVNGELTIAADYGNIVFYQNGDYTYTYNGPSSVLTGGSTIAEWDNVSFYAFQNNDYLLSGGILDLDNLSSFTDNVTENAKGIGVGDGGFFSSDAIDGTEALVMEFDQNVSDVQLHLNDDSFFSFFDSVTVTAFNEAGDLVYKESTFDVVSFLGSADQAIQVDPVGNVDFKYIVIETSGFGDKIYLDEVTYTLSDNPTTNLDVTETFTYTLTDSDGDTSSADLVVNGNDIMLYDAAALSNDGGLGTDTLILSSGDDLDFSTIANIQNMEILDLAGADHAVSNLTVEDIINMTDIDNVLSIYGDSGDNVSKPVGSTETWMQTATGVDDGNGHTVDVYIVSDGINAVTVNIEQDIVVS
ncbi:Ig-like domain-containing protein [Sulfurimonas sp. HSL3-7]|uniref:Ig-like domain-containing protein n=1 Tax=Sulfonitrofixus jiaomeiensis TaxID=3131938 RepID=UPI0031F7847D